MRASRTAIGTVALLPLFLAAACQTNSESSLAVLGDRAVASSRLADASKIAKDSLAKSLGMDPSDLTVVGSGAARFPYLNRQVSTFKLADTKGNWFGVALDENLQQVEVDSLARIDREIRDEKYGALDESVVAMLALGAEKLEVVLWLSSVDEPLAVRPSPSKLSLSAKDIDAIYAEADQRRAKTLDQIVPPALERLRKFDPEARSESLSPTISARLSFDEILELARDPAIERIYFDPPATPELDMAKAATGVSSLHSAGITGSGVRVAITEAGGAVAESNSIFLGAFVQDSANACGPAGDHATAVAGVLKERRINLFGAIYGETGVAPDIELRVGGSCSTISADLHSASSRAANWGARAINLSWGIDTSLALGASDRFYDDMVFNRFRTIVKSAGNRANNPGCIPNDGVLTSPGLAYNVITVGGFNDANTPSWVDDTMYDCSSSANPSSTHTDRQKPELVAPAVDLMLVTSGFANLASFTGTSGAAPQVTGAAALLIHKQGTLAIWPEITRAIVMATARNIEGTSPLSDLDGAGGLSTSAAASLVDDPTRWGGMSYGCTSATPASLNLMTLSASPRTRHRVVLSWDTDPSLSGYFNVPSVDIDLVVVDATGRSVASSASWDNTNEVVEFDSWWGGTYTLQAKKFRCDSRTWLGWAWSTEPARGL